MGFYIVAIAVSLLLIASPADACLGRNLEETIFYTKMPPFESETDAFVKVILEDVNNDGIASAQVTQVFQAPTGSLQEGDKVLLVYNRSSCGPNNLQVGEKGTIFGKLSINEKGGKILFLYLRRYGDGQIFPFQRRNNNTKSKVL